MRFEINVRLEGEENQGIQFHSAPEECSRRLRLTISEIPEMLHRGELDVVEWAWRGRTWSTVRMVKGGRSVVVFNDGLILEEGNGGRRRGSCWFGPFYVSDPHAGDVGHGNKWEWTRA